MDVKAPAKGKKGAQVVEEPVMPSVWVAKGACPNAGRALRVATDALLAMVADMKAGRAVMHAGVIPLGAGGGAGGRVGGGREDAEGARPGTAATDTYASSQFSYGSDLQVRVAL